MKFIFVAVIAAAGSFAQSISGFGFAIIVMAIWPLVITFQSAVLVEVITAFIMVLYITVKLVKHINFKLLFYPLIASFISSTLGIAALMASNENLLRRIFGGLLILLAAYFLIYSDKVRIRPTIINGLIAGGLSGFFAGLLSIGGPPISAYLLSASEDKMEYNATMQFYFALTSVYIFAVHLLLGNITGEVINYSLAGLAGVAVGTTTGLRLFKKLSLDVIRKIVSSFMIVVGLIMIIKG